MVGNPLDSGTPGSRFVVGDLFAGLDPLPAIRALALPLADCLRNYNTTHGDDIIAHRSRNLHNEEDVLVGELLARTTMTYQLATSSSTTSSTYSDVGDLEGTVHQISRHRLWQPCSADQHLYRCGV